MARNSLAAPTLVAITVAVAGCGKAGEELGVVTGQITYEGKPVTSAIVLFENDARGIHMQAKLDEEGRFKVSMAAGYGLPLGTYQVAVKPTLARPGEIDGPVELPPNALTRQRERSDIPVKYRQAKASGLSVTVERGENLFDLALPPTRRSS